MSKTIAIVNSKAPYRDNAGKDALDLALIFGSFEQSISVFFHGEGVWQLQAQSPELVQQKNYLKTFAAFEFYDIENVYVCQASLQERGINELALEHVKILPQPQFSEQLSNHSTIFRF